MNNNTKKITTTAMLAAIAYVVVVVGRIPVVLFLKYDPKDIIITLGGLIWGPLTSFIVSVIVSMIEMVTISENGILGCIMNIVSSCSFACTVVVIFKVLVVILPKNLCSSLKRMVPLDRCHSIFSFHFPLKILSPNSTEHCSSAACTFAMYCLFPRTVSKRKPYFKIVRT